MSRVPEWAIQLSWWVSGSVLVGAAGYFASVNNFPWAIATGVLAALFALFAVALHRKKDKAEIEHAEQITVEIGEEKVTFQELVRSIAFDIVKVNAHTHMLGVSAEREWLRRRYPNCRLRSQVLTTLDRLQERPGGTAV